MHRLHLPARAVWATLGVLWLATIVGGLVLVARYDNTAGKGAAAPGDWPGGSHLVRDTTGPTLVMLAHPRCTCTRASLAELAEVLARASHRPKTYVVFMRPHGAGDDWDMTDLWQRAASIPGVTVVRDERGREVREFGAQTSGQVLLFDRAGRLRFAGGATGSRGHAGENAGRVTLVALLNDQTALHAQTPVFGCSLFGVGDTREMSEEAHDDTHDN